MTPAVNLWYATLARTLDVIHGCMTTFWVLGFLFLFFPLPQWQATHAIYCIVNLLVECPFGWKCPLNLWVRNLKEKADPRLCGEPYEPFIEGIMKKLGINFVTNSTVFSIMIIGTAVSAANLIRLIATYNAF
ncbi:MAG: hypothetical protein ACREGH_00195 [Minisyncoccia bacterium]